MLQQKSQRLIRNINLQTICIQLEVCEMSGFLFSQFYNPSCASITLRSFFSSSWSLVSPCLLLLSECNLALGGSCRLNCDPLMTLQLYPSLHTHTHSLKCLLLLRTENNSHVSQEYVCPMGYCLYHQRSHRLQLQVKRS